MWDDGEVLCDCLRWDPDDPCIHVLFVIACLDDCGVRLHNSTDLYHKELEAMAEDPPRLQDWMQSRLPVVNTDSTDWLKRVVDTWK
jgi:hypothetical protein